MNRNFGGDVEVRVGWVCGEGMEEGDAMGWDGGEDTCEVFLRQSGKIR